MMGLLVFKERLRTIYGKYGYYIKPAMKFILGLMVFILISSNVGFNDRISSISLTLIMALFCSIMPAAVMVILAAVVILFNFYTLSMELAIIALAIFLLMFLLYFRFSPRDGLVILITPVLFMLKIPYVIPLVMGIVGSGFSIIPVGFGTVVYYMISYAGNNETVLLNSSAETTGQKYMYIIDSIVNNKLMLIVIVAFSIAILLTYFVKNLSISYSWDIAIGVGSIAMLVTILVGDFLFDVNAPIIATIFGVIISAGIALVLRFFILSVDYTSTETVQFEDDEYYYYVKAVPKINVTTPEKNIKRINAQKAEQAAEHDIDEEV